MVEDIIAFVAGAVVAVAVPAVYKFVAKQFGWAKAKVETVSVPAVLKDVASAVEKKV